MGRNKSLHVRLAVPDDAEQMLAIYAPVVENTGISFEELSLDVLSFRKRIEEIIETYPWLVAEVNGKVAGYAYATPHRSRAAYAWSAEVSIYIAVEHRSQGVGTALYHHLFLLMQQLGYRNLYAIITLPNQASIRLHERFGFCKIGLHSHAGYKLGKWHDVLWMERDLFEEDKFHNAQSHALDNAQPPTPISQLTDSGGLNEPSL
ncbi:MAG: N-acetyltransferase [Chlorobi bacterium]|nr:N-acetyltransferase [Chlorobiota bacterium]